MPKIVDKAVKKMEILHGAMRVFARKGVVKTKMIDIAVEAGIGKGTIYEYFKSKEDIFSSASHYFFESLKNELNHTLQKEEDPLRQLELIVLLSSKSISHADGEFADIMMDFWAEGVRNKNQELLNKINLTGIYADYRKIIRKIIRNGIARGIFRQVDTAAAASVFIGAIDGIMLQWILDRKIINLKKVTNVLLDSFINGIKK